jgi:hypothetical protein
MFKLFSNRLLRFTDASHIPEPIWCQTAGSCQTVNSLGQAGFSQLRLLVSFEPFRSGALCRCLLLSDAHFVESCGNR